MTDRFETLNDTQRRLLREVAKGRTSKAMSRDVGLEAGTIDVYLSQTLRILGFNDRRIAADAFKAYESAILNRSELRPEDVANPPRLGAVCLASEGRAALALARASAAWRSGS